MTQPTPSLAEFLLARIAEDEAMVPEVNRDDDYGTGFNGYEGGVDVAPRRWLAECEAKRRAVEWAEANPTTCGDVHPTMDMHCFGGHGPHPTLRALAAPYADHPDYRQEWAV